MTLPPYLLRSLTHKTRVTTTDSYGATVTDTWSDTTISGKIDQRVRTEQHADGREAEISEWVLYTDTDISADDQIVDVTDTYQVVGQPWPVYDGSGIHHYEATLRLVVG